MANRFTELLRSMRLGDDDEFEDDYYYDEEEDDIDEEEEERLLRNERKRQEKAERKAARRRTDYAPSAEEVEDEAPAAPRRASVRTSSNKVVPIRTAANGAELCICKPKNVGDANEVCELLLEGWILVVNLEGIDIMEAQRVMDVISGCIFAISGKMRQASRYIFVFSPENVNLSSKGLDITNDEEIGIPALSRDF